jgi:hypothetical protein
LAIIFLSNTSAFAENITNAMCKNYIPAVWAIAKPMRDVGIPIATAEEHVYKMGVEDKNIRLYLKSLVADIYKNPDVTLHYIETGKAIEDCVIQARGF